MGFAPPTLCLVSLTTALPLPSLPSLSLSSELLWLVEWHAGYRLEISVDSADTLKRLGTESSIILANHASDIDWLLGWVVAHKFNILGVS